MIQHLACGFPPASEFAKSTCAIATRRRPQAPGRDGDLMLQRTDAGRSPVPSTTNDPTTPLRRAGAKLGLANQTPPPIRAWLPLVVPVMHRCYAI
jgi:hypothetical protein